jgi:hypothetical protein
MPFLDWGHARDAMVLQQCGSISDELLARNHRLVCDDPAGFTHPLNLVGRVLIAPIAMAEDVERLQRDSMRNPDAHGTGGRERSIDDGIEEISERTQVADIAAHRVKPHDDLRIAVQGAECDRLNMLLGHDLYRGDANSDRWIGRETT